MKKKSVVNYRNWYKVQVNTCAKIIGTGLPSRIKYNRTAPLSPESVFIRRRKFAFGKIYSRWKYLRGTCLQWSGIIHINSASVRKIKQVARYPQVSLGIFACLL